MHSDMRIVLAVTVPAVAALLGLLWVLHIKKRRKGDKSDPDIKNTSSSSKPEISLVSGVADIKFPEKDAVCERTEDEQCGNLITSEELTSYKEAKNLHQRERNPQNLSFNRQSVVLPKEESWGATSVNSRGKLFDSEASHLVQKLSETDFSESSGVKLSESHKLCSAVVDDVSAECCSSSVLEHGADDPDPIISTPGSIITNENPANRDAGCIPLQPQEICESWSATRALAPPQAADPLVISETVSTLGDAASSRTFEGTPANSGIGMSCQISLETSSDQTEVTFTNSPDLIERVKDITEDVEPAVSASSPLAYDFGSCTTEAHDMTGQLVRDKLAARKDVHAGSGVVSTFVNDLNKKMEAVEFSQMAATSAELLRKYEGEDLETMFDLRLSISGIFEDASHESASVCSEDDVALYDCSMDHEKTGVKKTSLTGIGEDSPAHELSLVSSSAFPGDVGNFDEINKIEANNYICDHHTVEGAGCQQNSHHLSSIATSDAVHSKDATTTCDTCMWPSSEILGEELPAINCPTSFCSSISGAMVLNEANAATDSLAEKDTALRSLTGVHHDLVYCNTTAPDVDIAVVASVISGPDSPETYVEGLVLSDVSSVFCSISMSSVQGTEKEESIFSVAVDSATAERAKVTAEKHDLPYTLPPDSSDTKHSVTATENLLKVHHDNKESGISHAKTSFLPLDSLRFANYTTNLTFDPGNTISEDAYPQLASEKQDTRACFYADKDGVVCDSVNSNNSSDEPDTSNTTVKHSPPGDLLVTSFYKPCSESLVNIKSNISFTSGDSVSGDILDETLQSLGYTDAMNEQSLIVRPVQGLADEEIEQTTVSVNEPNLEFVTKRGEHCTSSAGELSLTQTVLPEKAEQSFFFMDESSECRSADTGASVLKHSELQQLEVECLGADDAQLFEKKNGKPCAGVGETDLQQSVTYKENACSVQCFPKSETEERDKHNRHAFTGVCVTPTQSEQAFPDRQKEQAFINVDETKLLEQAVADEHDEKVANVYETDMELTVADRLHEQMAATNASACGTELDLAVTDRLDKQTVVDVCKSMLELAGTDKVDEQPGRRVCEIHLEQSVGDKEDAIEACKCDLQKSVADELNKQVAIGACGSLMQPVADQWLDQAATSDFESDVQQPASDKLNEEVAVSSTCECDLKPCDPDKQHEQAFLTRTFCEHKLHLVVAEDYDKQSVEGGKNIQCVEQAATAHTTEQPVEQSAADQAKDQSVGQAILDEAKDQSVGQAILDEAKDQSVKQGATDQGKEQSVEQAATDEAKEQFGEYATTDHNKEQSVEQATTDQIKEQSMEQVTADEAKGQFGEYTVTDQGKEQSMEQVTADEAKGQFGEYTVTDQGKERSVEQASTDQVMEQVTADQAKEQFGEYTARDQGRKQAATDQATADETKKQFGEHATTDHNKEQSVEQATTDQVKEQSMEQVTADQAKEQFGGHTVTDQGKEQSMEQVTADQAKEQFGGHTVTDQGKEQSMEQVTADEAKGQFGEYTATDQGKEQSVEQAATDQVMEQSVEHAATDQVKEQATADEAKEQFGQHATTDQGKDQSVEQAATDQAKEQFGENSATDQAKEQSVEQAATDQVMEQVTADEAKEQTGEHATTDQGKDQSVEQAATDQVKEQATADEAKEQIGEHTTTDQAVKQAATDQVKEQATADEAKEQLDQAKKQSVEQAHAEQAKGQPVEEAAADQAKEQSVEQIAADQAKEQSMKQAAADRSKEQFVEQADTDQAQKQTEKQSCEGALESHTKQAVTSIQDEQTDTHGGECGLKQSFTDKQNAVMDVHVPALLQSLSDTQNKQVFVTVGESIMKECITDTKDELTTVTIDIALKLPDPAEDSTLTGILRDEQDLTRCIGGCKSEILSEYQQDSVREPGCMHMSSGEESASMQGLVTNYDCVHSDHSDPSGPEHGDGMWIEVESEIKMDVEADLSAVKRKASEGSPLSDMSQRSLGNNHSKKSQKKKGTNARTPKSSGAHGESKAVGNKSPIVSKDKRAKTSPKSGKPLTNSSDFGKGKMVSPSSSMLLGSNFKDRGYNGAVAPENGHLPNSYSAGFDRNNQNLEKDSTMDEAWSYKDGMQAEYTSQLCNGSKLGDHCFQESEDELGGQDWVGMQAPNGSENIELSVMNIASSGTLLAGVVTVEFSFPTELCGRLIGRSGRNVQHIKEQSGASVIITSNPVSPDFQICRVQGPHAGVHAALTMIKKKFPQVDVQPIVGANLNPLIMPDMIKLNLPDGVSVKLVVSTIVNAGHIFVQLPNHPTFASLDRLCHCMNSCYSKSHGVPSLPRPVETGLICAAESGGFWYRVQILSVYPETDECDIVFVDYGGYERMTLSSLRQIRSDFMTLPFQAVECYMANITPLQDEEFFSENASSILHELTSGKLLDGQVITREGLIPYVHLYQISARGALLVNREMVNREVVRWIEIF